MGVVVIVGFSCTGKSTMLRNFEEDPDCKSIQLEDTDKRISQSAGGNIYKIFLQNTKSEADKIIAEQELDFLAKFEPREEGCIIAAGPILPTRVEAFDAFVKRTDARCIWLSISAAYAEEQLVARQNRIAAEDAELAKHENFGSWNEPHLMHHDAQKNCYTIIADKDARVAATEKLLRQFESRYSDLAGGRTKKYFVELPERRNKAQEKIKQLALH